MLTKREVLDAHAQFGPLDRGSVKRAMGANWPAEWDDVKRGEGIFAAECDHEWKVPPGWQSGYCTECGASSTQR